MAKSNLIKTCKVVVISKTLSGNDFIVSLQEGQGKVHTHCFNKEESSKVDLGDKLQITIGKVE
jgi:hypothetical protein